MFGFYISLPFLFFALYRLFIVLYNYITRPFLPQSTPTDQPLISVIISTQVDESNSIELFNSLQKQTYQNIEILISEDREKPARRIEFSDDLLIADKRIKRVEILSVPEGWIFKNYICDYLSQHARGQYIIFIETGVMFDSKLVANALSYMQLNDLSLLTLFSTQTSDNQLNKIHSTIQNWLLISMNPLRRIMISGSESLSATSNQFMMFEAVIYKTTRWHEKYKSSMDIDFVIGRLVKRSKVKMASLLNDFVALNKSAKDEVDNTFSFVFNFFGRNKVRLFLFTFASTIGPILIVLLLPFPLVFLYLFSIVFARMLFAVIIGRSALFSLLTLPVHHFVFLFLIIKKLKK